MLPRKQHELLMFIHERIKETGVSPSFDEMKEALDLASKSGIHRLITALEERGFIRRLPNRARAIEVIKLPDSVAHGISGGGRSRGFNPSVFEGDLGRDLPANDERVDYLRSTLTPGPNGPVAHPLPNQDSSLMAPLAAADCLVIREAFAPAASSGSPCIILKLGL